MPSSFCHIFYSGISCFSSLWISHYVSRPILILENAEVRRLRFLRWAAVLFLLMVDNKALSSFMIVDVCRIILIAGNPFSNKCLETFSFCYVVSLCRVNRLLKQVIYLLSKIERHEYQFQQAHVAKQPYVPRTRLIHIVT